MANTRRSARLTKSDHGRRSSIRKTPAPKAHLESLDERDGTPEAARASSSRVLATPRTARTVHGHVARESLLRTPNTAPQPGRGEMHPKTIQQSTAKAPDSGLKLGFADIPESTDLQNTPSKAVSKAGAKGRQSMISSMPTNFEFKFAAQTVLSAEAQSMMDSVRADAMAIKAQLAAEKTMQKQMDAGDEGTLGSPRKIATAKGKSGRFSDVHMAQFRKMDSIENHASSFRAKPGFAAPTSQSLKRSPSKADLDGSDGFSTAARATPKRATTSSQGRPNATSPFKLVPTPSERLENPASTKRIRRSEFDDVSSARTPTIAHARQGSLHSPTKSSVARTARQTQVTPTVRSVMPSPSRSMSSYRQDSPSRRQEDRNGMQMSTSPSKIPQTKPLLYKPLPALPFEAHPGQQSSPTSKEAQVATSPRKQGLASRLPTFSGLKSILRSPKKIKASEHVGTPKRLNTFKTVADSPKKVDFTPSVKSRYAVKLATDSPGPAKARQETSYKAVGPLGVLHDSSAFTIDTFMSQDGDEEVDSDITYPALPPISPSLGPVDHTFAAKSREHNRRESKELKSIFAGLHPQKRHQPTTLTSVNTVINKTNPAMHAKELFRSPGNPANTSSPSPSTIRRVRESGPTVLVQPYEDRVATTTHDLPGKKRRHESTKEDENVKPIQNPGRIRRVSKPPAVPGAWNDSVTGDQAEHESENQDPDLQAREQQEVVDQDSIEDEGDQRGSKRVKITAPVEMSSASRSPLKPNSRSLSSAKKPRASTAREIAARTAKERKLAKSGVLSLSRLNMLSRPKQR